MGRLSVFHQNNCIGCGFAINSCYYVEIYSLCIHFGTNGCWFLSVLFLHLLRMIIWFSLFLCCDISQWLICVLWTILVNLGWIFHGVWSFSSVVGFILLIFCWEFLHLYASKILAWNFVFWWSLCLVLVSGWWWLYRMSLGVFLPLQSFGRVWEGSVKIFLCLFGRIFLWSHLGPGLLFVWSFFFFLIIYST